MANDPITLIRGDRFFIEITNLRNQFDQPVTLGDTDVLTFMVKTDAGKRDNQALCEVPNEQITLSNTGDSAEVQGVASDWKVDHLIADTPMVWDIQLCLGGDTDQIITIGKGEGVVEADIKRASP